MKKQLKKALAAGLSAMLCLTLTLPAQAAESDMAQTSTSAGVYTAYANFLQMYKTAQDNHFYTNDPDSAEAEKINSVLCNSPDEKLSYALVDLADDGEPELLIAGHVEQSGEIAGGFRSGGYIIFDTYGYSQGEAGRLFDTYSMGNRVNYSIMEDNVILLSGSGGASRHVMRYYSLGTDSITPELNCFAEYDSTDGSEKWYYGANDDNEKQQISEAAYNELLNSYTYKTDIEWYALGDLSGLRAALGLDEIPVFVNGNALDCDQAPVIRNGRTLVPLRAIFESLGATVDWNAATRSVTSTLGDTTIKLSIGANTMYKNGTAVTLDVPAQIIGDRTMVPVRAIAEAFGAEVVWDNATRAVYITE